MASDNCRFAGCPLGAAGVKFAQNECTQIDECLPLRLGIGVGCGQVQCEPPDFLRLLALKSDRRTNAEHRQRLGASEDRRVAGVVVESALCGAVDQCAAESQIGDGAFELVGGGLARSACQTFLNCARSRQNRRRQG